MKLKNTAIQKVDQSRCPPVGSNRGALGTDVYVIGEQHHLVLQRILWTRLYLISQLGEDTAT